MTALEKNYSHYNSTVDAIINLLEKDTHEPAALDKIQTKLDLLADKYQEDEALGTLRYKLYQAQAMLLYREGHNNEAIACMHEAIKLKGGSYKFAEEFFDNVLPEENAITEPPEFNGEIDGWLSWFGINFVITPVFFVYYIFSGFGLLNKAGAVRLTKPEVYKDVRSLALTIVIFYAIELLLLGVFGYFFFKRKRYTRAIAIGFLIFVIYVAANIGSVAQSFASKYGVQSDASSNSSTGVAILWLLYWIFSKRVKATFVK